ncbi:hypothetical protein GGQ85_000014 [Nitrobacter vulgaris]|jgi:hypothetical protein|uniref:hypothetical protein n=1 Tax=Nitrobacter vulgaris TaxID=29421 RepID=UPI002862E677|nr:hypothetical protein [Nitrobacter vulgaris]MDR6302343.1 hypothetical protein [Nitrobacter vulgaris]HKU70781.1 hypothetical protein [Burkholderiales bacterium]
MTSIKDKLASSVRQAKTGAEPIPEEKTETRKTARSASTPAKTAAKRAPTESLAAEPPDSKQELFPDRIWPD